MVEMITWIAVEALEPDMAGFKHPKNRDRVIKLLLLFSLVNIIMTGSLLYAVMHFQPAIITDTIGILDKLWPF